MSSKGVIQDTEKLCRREIPQASSIVEPPSFLPIPLPTVFNKDLEFSYVSFFFMLQAAMNKDYFYLSVHFCVRGNVFYTVLHLGFFFINYIL